MPPSNQQSPAHKEFLSPANPVALRPHDRVSSDFDRSRLGIPAENDEYNRGLIFFFDPSTGQPSVPSTCEESDVLGETPPYQPSRSSDHSSSCKINTPQSVSDIPGGLQPRAVASASVGLSDGESSECGADHPYPPSVSARASVGAIEAPPSPETIQEATSLLTAGSSTVTAMSPTLGPSLAEASDPLGDMSGPQAIIHINQKDVGFLEKIMSTPLSDQMDLLHSLTGQSITPPHPEAIWNSEAKREEAHRTTLTHTRTVAVRKPKCPRPRLDPIGPRLTTKDTTDKEKIEKAKLMRRIGVCLPCLVNHERCDLRDTCDKCLRGSPKIPKTPCVRLHLRKVVLFREGALSYPNGLPDLKALVSRRNVPLLLYNVGPANASVSPESRPCLKVACREFPSTPGIRSTKSWTKGTCKIDIHLPNVVMTPHQCSEAAKNLDSLVETEYEKLVGELATGQDDIVSLTLTEAVRQADKCSAIKGALQISILSRLASKSFNIYGQETLGIRQEQDPQCPYYKRIPIPPLLDFQLDLLLMEKMKILGKWVLSELRRMIAGQSRKHWFKIYLTMSILLLNLESVYQNQCRQIQRYKERTVQQLTMLQTWEDAAQNLIQHFRAVCRGHIPLNVAWSKTEQDAAEVDDRSLGFITQLQGLAQSRVDDLRERSTAPPETPLKWISALFLPEEKV